MALTTQPYKGTRDFYPEDFRVRQYIFDTWSNAVKRYGYEQYDTPLVEPLELYAAKSGEEIVNEETFSFKDRGDRQVTIRPEMTPSVSRLVAGRRQELAYPARLFSIPSLWRYERPQKGRLREHWQLNVDIFGVETIDAELELILISRDIMEAFGAKSDDYVIKINSRRLVMLIMADYLELDAIGTHQMIKLFDKKSKMPEDTFRQAAIELIPEDALEKIQPRLDDLLAAKTMADLPKPLLESKPIKQVQILFTLLAEQNITNAVFDVSLMRGFDYYTDIVFEVFDTDEQNPRSIFGGGRYDGLVGLFGVDPVPTVGFGLGDVTMLEFLKAHEYLPKLNSETDLAVVVVGDVLRQAQGVASILRNEGLNVSVDMTQSKIDKQLKNIAKNQIPQALFVGEAELEEEQFKLRDMRTKEETKMSLERVITELLDRRKQG